MEGREESLRDGGMWRPRARRREGDEEIRLGEELNKTEKDRNSYCWEPFVPVEGFHRDKILPSSPGWSHQPGLNVLVPVGDCNRDYRLLFYLGGNL